MASLTRWAWVWVNSGSWRWTGRPGVLRFMGSQRVGHDWATELKHMHMINFYSQHYRRARELLVPTASKSLHLKLLRQNHCQFHQWNLDHWILKQCKKSTQCSNWRWESSPSSPVSMVKYPPATQEMHKTWIWSLGQKDPLEKEMATHSSIHAWRIPWTEESRGLQSMKSQRVRHDWATNTSVN